MDVEQKHWLLCLISGIQNEQLNVKQMKQSRHGVLLCQSHLTSLPPNLLPSALLFLWNEENSANISNILSKPSQSQMPQWQLRTDAGDQHHLCSSYTNTIT